YPWSHDGTQLATITDGAIAIWDIAQRKKLAQFASEGISDAIWSRQGAYLIAIRQPQPQVPRGASRGNRSEPPQTSHCYVDVWDVAKNQRFRSFSMGDQTIGVDLTWSPDELTIATRFERDVILWDLKSGNRKQQLTLPARRPPLNTHRNAMEWSPDGKSVAVMLKGHVHIWQLNQ